MKSSLKAKLIQHLAAKKGNAGFTLIELLVVIIIIGILSAIALPSFLNQANKAKQSEAKTYIGSLNRGQQAYYLENGIFASGDGTIASAANTAAVDQLGIGVKETSSNYAYVIFGAAAGTGVTNQAHPIDPANAVPTPLATASIKAYRGPVGIQATTTGENTTVALLCEALTTPNAGGPTGTGEGDYTQITADPDAACTANAGAGGYESLD